MKKVKILSFPSRHPYMSKFNTGEIKFVNPNSDYFSDPYKCSEKYLNQNHRPGSYDIVHIHFSFDMIPLKDFENLLKYFKKIKKPIIWTCHSKESQRIKNYGKGKYQRLLFKYADQIISPTKGCARYIKSKYGKHKNDIKIIPLGFMADPKDVKRIGKRVKKNKHLFTMLIGEFRENKEFIQSIIDFLQCPELKKAKLQLIFKPIHLYKSNRRNIKSDIATFYRLIQNSRIKIISLPEIPNEILIKAFLKSHAIILYYKWGTHSGQIELAKDCGCHVVISNVGFYTEQWNKLCLWNASDKKYSQFPKRYTNALIKAYQRKSLEPLGNIRKKEFKKIFKDHLTIYKKFLLKKIHQ